MYKVTDHRIRQKTNKNKIGDNMSSKIINKTLWNSKNGIWNIREVGLKNYEQIVINKNNQPVQDTIPKYVQEALEKHTF